MRANSKMDSITAMEYLMIMQESLFSIRVIFSMEKSMDKENNMILSMAEDMLVILLTMFYMDMLKSSNCIIRYLQGSIQKGEKMAKGSPII